MLLAWKSPVKNGATARIVSGIIDSSPAPSRTPVPNRIPRYAEMNSNRSDRTVPTMSVKYVTG